MSDRIRGAFQKLNLRVENVAEVAWNRSGRSKVRSVILFAIASMPLVMLGCQGVARRASDGLTGFTESDDDWSYPNRSSSPIPPSVAKRLDERRQEPSFGRSAGQETARAPSVKLPDGFSKSPGLVAYGARDYSKSEAPSVATASASSSPVSSPSSIASTDAKELDIEGALGSLPAEYRDVLKKQLEVVQTKLANHTKSDAQPQAQRSHEASIAESQSSPNVIDASPSSKVVEKGGVSIRLSDSSSNPASNASVVSQSETTQPNSVVQKASLATDTSRNSEASRISEATVVTASANIPASAGSNISSSMQPPLSSLTQPTPAASTSSWKQQVSQAIELLEKQIKETPSTDEPMRLSQEVTLRLLYVSQRRLADACRPIDVDSMSDSEQEYVRNQMIALHEASNPDAMPVRSRHWSLVMNSQREATNHLAAASNLEVKSLAFCTEVERFGVISKFPKNQFQADQEVLLYCEIENVAAEKVRNGFETQLQGSYEIIDSQGRKIADQLLPMEPELCQNHRRDYFIVYKIYMPQQIAGGSYQLRLTIEDLKARKFGQGHVDFLIKR